MGRIIIIQAPDLTIECYSRLTVLCREREEMRYHTLKKKKFPFTYKGWRFQKIEVNRKIGT